MQVIQAAVMGTVQGLTEFLPVSSSGHIVLSSALYKLITGENLNIVPSEEIFFDILIHLATLIAVIIYFWGDIKNILKGFTKAICEKKYDDKNYKFGVYIIIATFITCVFSYLTKDFAHNLTQNPFIVSLFIMTTGCVLFISEKIKSKEKNMDLKTSIIIGTFQGLATLPGLSRSGMTISSAVFCGINKIEAAKFSFILSIPIIILASLIYPLISFDINDIKTFNYVPIIIGMLVSFIVGYICIKYFMKFLQKYGLKVFSYYCWIIGGLCALIFYFN